MATRKEQLERSIAEKETAKDLSDESVQAKILHPKPETVDIGGKPVQIYPVSGYDVRRLTALAQRAFIAAGREAAASAGAVVVEDHLERFLPILAAATFAKPSEIDQQQFAKIHEEIAERTANARGAIELATAFYQMLVQNGVLDSLQAAAEGKKEP